MPTEPDRIYPPFDPTSPTPTTGASTNITTSH